MKATNNYIFIIRDKPESQKGEMIIHSSGRPKPHTGSIVTAGTLVRDGNIKQTAQRHGRVMFPPNVGFEIEFEGVTYLVCQDHEIWSIL
jgi:co-chaperonin GroES (HSP10)